MTMFSNRSLLVLAATAALLFHVGEARAQSQVSQFNASGDYASLNVWDGNGYLYLNVYAGGTNQNPQAWLSFYQSSCTYSDTAYSCTGRYGWGSIPADAFKVHGRNATLHVDGSAIYTSNYTYSCDWTTWYCSYQTDSGTTGGNLDLNWSKNSEYSMRSVGQQEWDYLNMKFISNGTSTYSAANVSGSFLGSAVTSPSGTLGSSRNMGLSIIKQR